jgi:hypothetical protein
MIEGRIRKELAAVGGWVGVEYGAITTVTYPYLGKLYTFDMVGCEYPFHPPKKVFKYTDEDLYEKMVRFGIEDRISPRYRRYIYSVATRRLFDDDWTVKNTFEDVCRCVADIDSFFADAFRLRFVFENVVALPTDLMFVMFPFMDPFGISPRY